MEEYQSKKIVIDYFGLVKVIKSDKLWMGLFVGLAAVLGLAVAFGTPKEYKSSVICLNCLKYRFYLHYCYYY